MPDSIFTRAVHAGEGQSASERPTVGGIQPSTTYQSDPDLMDEVLGGQRFGYTYQRHASPTVHALEAAVAELEGQGEALAYASGMAAIHAALLAAGVTSGDTVLLAQDLYGASTTLVTDVLGPLGVRAVRGDLADLRSARSLLVAHRPRAILFETISNPLLRLVDGPALTRLAHDLQARVLVDNTFATPLLCQPLGFGADMVIHSATKYLGGHGDATLGLVAASEALAAVLHRQRKLTGGIAGPFEAWLVHRGLKTLPLRFFRQCESAHAVAMGLVQQGLRVHFPLLAGHPDHERALALFPPGRCGAVVTCDLAADESRVRRFLRALRLVACATSVGDIYSLCLYPAMASHRSLTAAQRLEIGITEGTVRFSIGIEDPADILADILRALAASA